MKLVKNALKVMCMFAVMVVTTFSVNGMVYAEEKRVVESVISAETTDFVSQKSTDFADGFISATVQIKGEETETVITDFAEFKRLGGTYEGAPGEEMMYSCKLVDKIPSTCMKFYYKMNGTIIGDTVVYILPKTSEISIEAKDIELTKNESFDPSMTFEKLVYSPVDGDVIELNYEEFTQAFGKTESNVPNPLEVGTYNVTYRFLDVVKSINVNVPEETVETRTVIFNDQGIETRLEIEHNTIIPFTHIPQIQGKNGHQFNGWYTGENGTGNHFDLKKEKIENDLMLYAHYERDNVQVQIETTDLQILSHQQYDPRDGFQGMLIVTNGNTQFYNYDEFLAMGGQVQGPGPYNLDAGIYETEYSYEGTMSRSIISVSTYEIETKNVELKESDSYQVSDSFVELKVTNPQGEEIVHDFETFVAMGGDTKTDVSEELNVGVYQTEFSIEGLTQTAQVRVEADDVVITIKTKDINNLSHQAYDLSEGFVEMEITTNGKSVIYSYDEFVAMGGQIGAPGQNLEAGEYAIVYSYGDVQATSTLFVTTYEIITKDVVLKESDSYQVSDSFVELKVTNPQGEVVMHDFEAFVAMGGIATTNVTNELSVGDYQSEFSIEGLTQTAQVRVEEEPSTVTDLDEEEPIDEETSNITDSDNEQIIDEKPLEITDLETEEPNVEATIENMTTELPNTGVQSQMSQYVIAMVSILLGIYVITYKKRHQSNHS